jgi:predicted Zn-dependent protease
MLLSQSDRRLDEALGFAKQAAASPTHPNRANFCDTLAFVLMRRKEYPSAVQAIEQALALRPEDPTFQIRLATILVDARQLDRAALVIEQLKSQERDRAFPPNIASELQSLQDRLARRRTTSAKAS